MREIVEFRVVQRFASMLFRVGEGKRLGDSIRKIEIDTRDPRFVEIGRLQRELQAKHNSSFFLGWGINRSYTIEELAKAACFQLTVSAVFEPAGEECGTEYDETKACATCGVGAIQVGGLRLDLRKVPKRADIARTIANEIIVSQRFAEQMIDAGLTGFELSPVRHKARYEDDPLDFREVPTGIEILRRAVAAGAPHPTGRFMVWLNRAENRRLVQKARAEFATSKAEQDLFEHQSMPVWHQLVVTSDPT